MKVRSTRWASYSVEANRLATRASKHTASVDSLESSRGAGPGGAYSTHLLGSPRPGHPTRPFPRGRPNRTVGEGTAFAPALILTFFLALLWTLGSAELIASIGDQCEPVLS